MHSALDGGEWWALRSGRFTQGEWSNISGHCMFSLPHIHKHTHTHTYTQTSGTVLHFLSHFLVFSHWDWNYFQNLSPKGNLPITFALNNRVRYLSCPLVLQHFLIHNPLFMNLCTNHSTNYVQGSWERWCYVNCFQLSVPKRRGTKASRNYRGPEIRNVDRAHLYRICFHNSR